MAIQAPILMPELVRQWGNMNVQKPIVGDSTNTFKARALLTITAGVLVLIATDGVLIYGQTPDKSHAATEIPPDAFFGENHYVFSPLDAEFEINVGALSSTAIVVGPSAAKPGDVVIGGQYAIATPTTGDWAGYQFLDPTDTTNKLFQVVGKVDGVNDSDQNGRVRVKIVPVCIQN